MSDLSRREFLKITSAASLGAAVSPGIMNLFPPAASNGGRLGRVLIGQIDVKAAPDSNSTTAGLLYEDAVVDWQREVVGSSPQRINQRFVQTPDGFVYAPFLQPVKNEPNEPVTVLPETSLGSGAWAEVTVPFVDLVLHNPPARAPWLRATDLPRLYFSQVLWIDSVEQDESGTTWYRVNERYGFGDIFWANAEAFRILTAEELAPIRPEVEDKRVVIDVSGQTMSCFEDGREVYHCRISTGAKFDARGKPVDEWATPLGPHPIWRKLISTHMVGGTTGGGYDLPGIGWTTLFVGNGVAIHSTFWHNDYGFPRSHGCVNAKPEDAKWVFRWVTPNVDYDPGDITVGMPGGTIIDVVET